MNSTSATHVRHLPTGEIVRIVKASPAGATTWLGELVDGHQVELRLAHCTIHVTTAEIAEYQRLRSLWHSLAFFNPPTSDHLIRKV